MTTRTEENRQLQTHTERRVIPLGYQDRKRRKIGAQVATWNAVLEIYEPRPGFGRVKLPPGPAFGLNVMQTRDGAAFGASQPSQWFATAEEREAAVAAYLDGARKRAARHPDFTAI